MSAAEIAMLDQTQAAEKGAPATAQDVRIDGVAVGVLVGFRDDGRTPLVTYPLQSNSAAIRASTIVDLHGAHIGRRVVLQFENGHPLRPIVMGMLRTPTQWPLPDQPGQVEVEADGERLIVNANEQLVLRCGKASVTLTKAGKVIIQGTYVSHRSSGTLRIRGGSVQIN